MPAVGPRHAALYGRGKRTELQLPPQAGVPGAHRRPYASGYQTTANIYLTLRPAVQDGGVEYEFQLYFYSRLENRCNF